MTDEHLGKLWVIDCCKDGTLTFRRAGAKGRIAEAMPVWSVDTATQAERLIALVGNHRPIPHPRLDARETWYVLPVVEGLAQVGIVKALHAATGLLREGERFLSGARPLAVEEERRLGQAQFDALRPLPEDPA